jgi:hypothetical protein
MDVKDLPAGRWFVRVSAIDEERFEGAFLAPAMVEIAQAQLSSGGPGMVRVTLSAPGVKLVCGLDDDPLVPRAEPFEVSARVARRLRCAPLGAPAHVAEMTVPAVKLTLSARLARSGPDKGVIEVSVHDESGQFLPGLPLVARPQAPLKVGTFRESDGHYRAEASWPPDSTRIAADLDVSDDLVGIKFSVKFTSPQGGPDQGR